MPGRFLIVDFASLSFRLNLFVMWIEMDTKV